MYQVKYGAVIG